MTKSKDINPNWIPQIGKMAKPEETSASMGKDQLERYEETSCKVKPLKKRYFILCMFVTLNVIKSFQWICLASITNVVTKFYQVDNVACNWTTVVFMVTFLTLSLPISWLMNFIGLRKSVIIGALGVTLGVVIKCFSCHRDGFLLNFIGHVIIGFAEPFFFSIYAQLASVWFPDDQVSLATSIGVLGDELGIALGFIVPSFMVGNDPDDLLAVQSGLYNLSLIVALIACANSLLLLIFFDEQPKYPPGLGRLNQIQQRQLELEEQKDWTMRWKLYKPLGDLRNLISDKNFIILLLSFGINLGTNYSLHTVLNQMLLAPFIIKPSDLSSLNLNSTTTIATSEMNNHQTVGDAGLILIIAGLFGLLTFGHLLDRLHRYKLITVACYALSLIWMLIFTGGLYLHDELAVYLLAAPLGFFVTAYAGCGFEYGVELTYPRPELLTSTLLNISAQIFGIPITFGASYVVDHYGSLAAGLFLASMLLIGLILNCLQSGELKRQTAVLSQQQHQQQQQSKTISNTC